MTAAPVLTPMSPMDYFSKFIEKELGIIYDSTNIYQLETRINGVCKALGVADTNELHQKCLAGVPSTWKQLILDTATNNETSFFRDKNVFKAIESFVLPQIIANRKNAIAYRLWSVACSTGQEPYTLSMIIKSFQKENPNLKFEILASDFSQRVLDRSKTGVYSQLEIQRGLPTNLLLKYFTKTPDSNWQVAEELRSMIQWQYLNIIEPWSKKGPFDVIFCRNVLIYQNVENKKKVIKKLSDELQPKGFLVLGAAESLIGLSDEFNQVMAEGVVVYQKK